MLVFIGIGAWAQSGSGIPEPPSPGNVALPQGNSDRYHIFFEAFSTRTANEDRNTPSLYSTSTTLATVLKILRDTPTCKLLIEGFANPVSGTKAEVAELIRLSRLRAMETENRFVRDGIERSRFVSIGQGGIGASGNNESRSAQNRRVTMTVIRDDNSKRFRINFENEYAIIAGRTFFAQPQIDALQTILAVTEYVKANPGSRILIEGYETTDESKVKRSGPISKMRAKETERLLRKEFAREEITDFHFVIFENVGIGDCASEIIILNPSTQR
jgi:outer membrane protein OmpA-like peptidoglycan-associated protein